MGYRNYIASIPKKEYNKIKSMNENELKDYYNLTIEEGEKTWYKGVYTYGVRLYELGQVDFIPPKKYFKPFFKNKELQNKYKEEEFYVVTKEFLAYIIEHYKQKITNYYLDMLNPFLEKNETQTDFLKSCKINYDSTNKNVTFDFNTITQKQQNALYKIFGHIESMNMEWTHLSPFDLNDGEQTITNSWKFEYAIFELVRIYKSFDWKRNVMLYYGF